MPVKVPNLPNLDLKMKLDQITKRFEKLKIGNRQSTLYNQRDSTISTGSQFSVNTIASTSTLNSENAEKIEIFNYSFFA
jgi:hypothetical protein